MANRIVTEIWDHAPVSGSDLIILHLLAENAGSDHRMTWIGTRHLMTYSGLARSTVFACLKRLQSRNIIREVLGAESFYPRGAEKYGTTVWRIQNRTEWDYTNPSRFQDGGEDSNTERSPSTTDGVDSPQTIPTNPQDGPYISTSTNTCNRDQVETSSLLRPATQGRRNITQRNSEKSQLEDLEADLDPAKVIDQEPGSSRERGTRTRTFTPDSGMGLVHHWISAMTKAGGRGWGPVVNLVNRKQLAATFNRWLHEDLSPGEIRMMIDLYASRPDFRSEGQAPWRDFLAKANRIHGEVHKRVRDRQLENSRTDDELWNQEISTDEQRRAQWDQYDTTGISSERKFGSGPRRSSLHPVGDLPDSEEVLGPAAGGLPSSEPVASTGEG